MFDVARFVAAVPTVEPDLRRLNQLHRTADQPLHIAVLGKYNHGKSMLLNALVGTTYFKVADRRETIEISEYEHDGVVWVDTPGLDADPTAKDDQQAQKVALEVADLLFLVHQVTVGELDRYEIKAFMELAKQDRNYRKKMALVLTKIDQLEPAAVGEVERRCRAQLQDEIDLRELDVISVSAVRHHNPRLRRMSGMEDVFARVERLKAATPDLRRREWSRLVSKVQIELKEKQQEIESEVTAGSFHFDKLNQRLRSDVTTLVRMLGEG